MKAYENELKAKVTYMKDTDEYRIYTSGDGGKTWDFSRGFCCLKAEGENEPNMVHYSALTEIGNLINLGYSVSVCGSPYASYK